MPTSKSQSNAELARATTTLGISIAGLVIVRFIVTGLPMFKDMGWIVKEKLTVVAAATIVVDAMLLSVLIGFAIQVRKYLLARFAQVPGLGSMAISFALLICAAIAYADFKPLTRAWPSIKDLYLWTFFLLATGLLVYVIVLLYQNRVRIAALVLRQSMPECPVKKPANVESKEPALAER
jgi:hypothetical protein